MGMLFILSYAMVSNVILYLNVIKIMLHVI